MSCPTWAHFENNKDGTQKRVFINLGWIPPTDFEMARIIVNASAEISDTYEWDHVGVPILDSYMTREKFNEMKLAVEGIDSLMPPSLSMHYRNRFTLDKAWIKH